MLRERARSHATFLSMSTVGMIIHCTFVRTGSVLQLAPLHILKRIQATFGG